jgi:hypothetical protein
MSELRTVDVQEIMARAGGALSNASGDLSGQFAPRGRAYSLIDYEFAQPSHALLGGIYCRGDWSEALERDERCGI